MKGKVKLVLWVVLKLGLGFSVLGHFHINLPV